LVEIDGSLHEGGG